MISSMITTQDLYGRHIIFTFEGEDSFKTFTGEVLSILIMLFMTVITILLTISLFDNGDTIK